MESKEKTVSELAKRYNTVIFLKSIADIISDGTKCVTIEGGNQGLTKGGTGDLLAGLTASFYSKNEPLESAVISSYLIKKSAEALYPQYGYWYNIDSLIKIIPKVLTESLIVKK